MWRGRRGEPATSSTRPRPKAARGQRERCKEPQGSMGLHLCFSMEKSRTQPHGVAGTAARKAHETSIAFYSQRARWLVGCCCRGVTLPDITPRYPLTNSAMTGWNWLRASTEDSASLAGVPGSHDNGRGVHAGRWWGDDHRYGSDKDRDRLPNAQRYTIVPILSVRSHTACM